MNEGPHTEQESLEKRFSSRIDSVVLSAPNYRSAKRQLQQELDSFTETEAERILQSLPGPTNTHKFNGAILRSAREQGCLSWENNGIFIGSLRDSIIGSLIAEKHLQSGVALMPVFREISKEENSENMSELLEKLALVQKQISESHDENDENRKTLGGSLGSLVHEILTLAKQAPATFFLHFFDNHDYVWLWGIGEEDEFGGLKGIVGKSGGLRTGDIMEATW